MEIEPVNMAFERECEWLIGPRRKRESAEDAMRRVVRIRELLRAESGADAVQAEADELRELALTADRHGVGQMWNAHRVWTWLSDRAEIRRNGGHR